MNQTALPIRTWRALASAVETDAQNFAELERGRHLPTASNCAACHTRPGGPPFAGGRPIETPFGNILAPNITPDGDTGIGGWSDQEFVSALREGKGRHGELFYPAVPYPSDTKMPREDVLAVRAWCATRPCQTDFLSRLTAL